jgi:hypothetical protein
LASTVLALLRPVRFGFHLCEATTNDMQQQSENTTESSDTITVSAPTVSSESQDREQIAALAHEFWKARGFPIGTPEEDWFRAEREIAASKRIAEKEVEERDERPIAAENADSLVLRFPPRSEVFHACYARGSRRA